MEKIKLHGKYGEGKFALVDSEDYEMVNLFRWQVIESDNYIYCATNTMINKITIPIVLHRLIMNISNDNLVDHRNHDTLDNRKQNLRMCNQGQNQMNRFPNKNSTSKYKGVSWHKKAKKWVARIRSNKERFYLGYFHEEEAAAQAYDIMARKLHGEFAYYNNIGVVI